MHEQLELHLHEQYAINNNANVSSFVAMVGSLLVAFTGYGYVIYQYLMSESGCRCGNEHALLMVHIATIAALVVICILYIVAVHIGASQRSDQFVIHKIREHAYEDEARLLDIYGNGYSPIGKTYLTFVQGIYNSLSWILLGVFFLVSCISWCKIHSDCCYLTAAIILGMAMLCYRSYKYFKYTKRLKAETLCYHNWRELIEQSLFPILGILLSMAAFVMNESTSQKCFAVIFCSISIYSIISIYCSNKE